MRPYITSEMEERFLDDIVGNHVTRSPLNDAKEVFLSVQRAFTPSKERWSDSVIVHPKMIANLAACAANGASFDSSDPYAEQRYELDYILKRTTRYFMATLREAIQEGRVHQSQDGTWLHGCFTIPQWFYDFCWNCGKE